MAATTISLIHRISKLLAFASKPLVAGSALVALNYGPPPLREFLIQLLSRQSIVSVESVIKTLKVCLAIGIVRTTNRFLNACATNQWQIQSNSGWQWDKEIAVITGGCGGIGKEVVLGLASKGVRVVIFDIIPLPEDLQQLSNVSLVPCDVTSAAAMNEAAETVRKSVGHPTILINNAGIGQPHSILDTTDDYLHKIFEVNLLSHWRATKQFLPEMLRKNKGHIVTVASLASFVGTPVMADYAATKAGALAFHEALTSELRHLHKARGIKTTIVHPSWVRTPMTERQAAKIERMQGPLLSPQRVAGQIVEQILSCRGGQLIIPSQLSFVSGLRGWPHWAQSLLKDRSGPQFAKMG